MGPLKRSVIEATRREPVVRPEDVFTVEHLQDRHQGASIMCISDPTTIVALSSEVKQSLLSAQAEYYEMVLFLLPSMPISSIKCINASQR